MGFVNFILGVVKGYFGILHDAWIDSEWFFLFVFVLIGLAVLYFVVSILFEIFLLLERIGTPIFEGQGRIVDKDYEPASTSYITTGGQGVAISTPITTGPNYYLEIQVPGGTDEFDTVSVNRKFYKRCREGALVKVSYRYGRFTRRLHIRELWG